MLFLLARVELRTSATAGGIMEAGSMLQARTFGIWPRVGDAYARARVGVGK